MRRRRGMALAVTIGVVSLIAILAVATLSLAGRLMQTSTLGLRDARLDAGTAFGLAAATDNWRQRHLGRLAIGASTSFNATPDGIPISVGVTVARVAADIFWVVAEASDGGGMRREGIVLRSRAPGPEILLDDSTNVTTLGPLLIDSIAATAEADLPSGSVVRPSDGVVHVRGDATLTGGTGTGVLVAEGRLIISGALVYEGIIVARGGISVVVPGVTITGMIRSGGAPFVAGNMAFNANGLVVQGVLVQSLTPSAVAGRAWGEMP